MQRSPNEAKCRRIFAGFIDKAHIVASTPSTSSTKMKKAPFSKVLLSALCQDKFSCKVWVIPRYLWQKLLCGRKLSNFFIIMNWKVFQRARECAPDILLRKQGKVVVTHCCVGVALSLLHLLHQNCKSQKKRASSAKGDPQCRTYCYFDCKLFCTFHQLSLAL